MLVAWDASMLSQRWDFLLRALSSSRSAAGFLRVQHCRACSMQCTNEQLHESCCAYAMLHGSNPLTAICCLLYIRADCMTDCHTMQAVVG